MAASMYGKVAAVDPRLGATLNGQDGLHFVIEVHGGPDGRPVGWWPIGNVDTGVLFRFATEEDASRIMAVLYPRHTPKEARVRRIDAEATP